MKKIFFTVAVVSVIGLFPVFVLASIVDGGDMPETTIDSYPADSDVWAIFTFSGTNAASFECWSDLNPSWYSCTSPHYFFLAEGPHTFKVKAIDSAGTEDSTPASYSWTITGPAPANLPNFTSYTPSGWDGPIDPSPLIAGDNTVIKFGIKNNSAVQAGFLWLHLYLDDGPSPHKINGPISLPPGLDVEYPMGVGIISAGSHDLRLELDATGVITESNENDNIISGTFTWVSPSLSAPSIISSSPSGQTVPPGQTTVSLDWDPVAGAISYEWRLTPSNVGWRNTNNNTIGTDTVNLSPGTSYTMSVKACGGPGCSPSSLESSVSFQTSGGQPPPGQSIIIVNPLKADSFQELLDAITNFIFWVGMTIAPVIFIIAGFLYVLSTGDTNRIKTAQHMMMYAAIGVVVLLLGRGLVAVLKSVIGAQ